MSSTTRWPVSTPAPTTTSRSPSPSRSSWRAALLRRPALQTDEILRLGELELDLRQRLVRLGDRTLNLSSREFALLEYLLRHAGQVLTRTQIGEGVWGLDFENDSNVVDVYVGYVRRKLTIGDGGPAIRTVRGVGYVLVGGAD